MLSDRIVQFRKKNSNTPSKELRKISSHQRWTVAVFTESFGHMRYDRRLGNGTKYYIPNTDMHTLKVISVVINVKYL